MRPSGEEILFVLIVLVAIFLFTLVGVGYSKHGKEMEAYYACLDMQNRALDVQEKSGSAYSISSIPICWR
jgi:ABC-type transporter Mla subunit MlaD